MVDSMDRLGNRTDESQLRYLRAADYAQQGQYDEAEAEFAAAISMNPALHTARFQLGLLQLTCGRAEEACVTWAALHDASVAKDLQHFVSGLEALIRDDFATSVAQLQSGIALNQTNPALSKDMAMVIERINSTVETAAIATPPIDPATATAVNPVRTDFSLYGKKAD